jgi:hypothetical protein
MKHKKINQLIIFLCLLVIVLLIIITIYLSKNIYEHMTIDKTQCDNGIRNIEIADKIVYPRPVPNSGIPYGNLNIVDYNGKDIMTPISLPMTDDMPFIYLEGKPYVDPNMVMRINEWKSLISQIKSKISHQYKDKYSKDEVKAMVTNSYSALLKTKQPISDNVDITDYGFVEMEGTTYDYFKGVKKNLIDFDWVGKMRNRVLDDVKREFNNVSFKIAQCSSSYNPCEIEEVDWRILKLGTNKSNGSKIIEGQLLIGVKNRPQLILIRYVASDESGYTLYTIYIEGLGDRSSRLYEGQYKSMCKEGNIIPNPNPLIKNDVLIDISMNEPQIVKPRSNLIKVVEKTLSDFYDANEPKCYGKLSATKSECEAVYDPAGRPNEVIGVWDKECRKDDECPFYKANKNYPNNFGGCISGKCQMPYGLTQVSPFKYRNEKNTVCYRCKDGLGCCDEQKDKNKYPKLKSPDYKFEGDELLRLQYYYLLQ